MTKEIISVTSAVKKIRKEIKLCDEVGDNSKKMKEQIKELNDKEKQKVKEKGIKRETKEKKKDER